MFDHKAFMEDPEKWPSWPLLPVKRYTEKPRGGLNLPDCALLYDDLSRTGVAPTVYLENLFTATPESMKTAEKIEYQDFADLIADGWVVD
jgi:hypothetical protein